MKRILKKFNAGSKGFTLIEILVAIAILGTLAGVAIPSVGGLMDKSLEEAAATELHNVQLAVLAAMADAGVDYVQTVPEDPPGSHRNFGQRPNGTFVKRKVATVGGVKYFVSDYLAGGLESVQGLYWVYRDGTVAPRYYPGLGYF